MKKERAGQQWISQPVSRPTPESKMKVATVLSESSFSSLKCGCDQAGIPSCIAVTYRFFSCVRGFSRSTGVQSHFQETSRLPMGFICAVLSACAPTRDSSITSSVSTIEAAWLATEANRRRKVAHPSVRYRGEKGAAHEC